MGALAAKSNVGMVAGMTIKGQGSGQDSRTALTHGLSCSALVLVWKPAGFLSG